MKINKMKCSGCGAPFMYQPGQKQQTCAYCGSQVVIEQAAELSKPTAAQTLRMKELDLEEHRINVAERQKARTDAEQAAWRRRTNVWLVLMVITTVLDVLIDTDAMDTLFACCFIFGGCYVFFSRPKTEKWLPWYHTWLGIFLIGICTAGAYWFIGPFLRIRWKKKNGRY